MAFLNWQKVLALAILIACVVAIPVGLLTNDTRHSEAQNDTSKKWASFLPFEDHLMVLRLSGMIYEDVDTEDIFLPNHDSASTLKRQLRKATENEHVKGILLRINSPGGTIAMSQEIYDAIQTYRKKGHPIVVSMGDVAASGGYYIASAADQIVADPGTLTGSIGVIMHLLNWQQTEKKIGLAPMVIKSGAFKDIGSPDRPMTESEHKLLQNIILDYYDQFVSAVATGRHLSKDQVRKLSDGRVFSGRQALAVKLIDKLGGFQDALGELQKLSRAKYKLDRDLPVDYQYKSLGFLSALLEDHSQSNSNLLNAIIPAHLRSNFYKQPLWIME